MEEIIEIIKTYGIETVLIALAINMLTAIIKMPIKKICSRLRSSKKATRFIVFLPIVIGFGITYVYKNYFDIFIFDKEFFTTWLTSTSLSLTFYAIFEKLFLNNQELDKEVEITQKVIEEIFDVAENIIVSDSNKNKRI